MLTRSLLFMLCFAFSICFGQVAINTDGSPPHASAVLDIQGNNGGLLVPRVQLTGLFDSLTIPQPALSLLVYNTNASVEGGTGFYTWNGSYWVLIMSAGNSYVRGKNRYLSMVGNDMREYYVHVPESYDGGEEVPVVFMLHGTSGDGEKFYNISGWKEVGEEENIITVYPSASRYCINDEGETKRTTKWNVLPDADWTLCPGDTAHDDVQFFRQIITELRTRFTIDTSRIYLVGFSAGGQMAAKCAVEMGDVFAAIVGNSGSFYIDTTYVPVRLMPVMFQVGNEDWGSGNTGPQLPLAQLGLALDSIHPLNFFNVRFHPAADRHIRNFGLDPNYTIIGDTSKIVTARYTGLSGDPLNIFHYVVVDGLAHVYPNGENHWLEGARLHWAWLRQYTLP